MPSGASPSLDDWLSLNITLGCLGNSQAQALATPPSPHIETSSIFDHFIHTKLNRKFGKIGQYNKANHYSKYHCKPIHILFFNCRYCNKTFPWLIPPIESIVSYKKNNASKTESILNRTVCSNLNIHHTFGTPKIMKKQEQ